MALFPHNEGRWRPLAKVALAAGLCLSFPLRGLDAAPAAAGQERVAARYREMLKSNPSEGTALERLWRIAEAGGTTSALMEEYAALAEQGDFSGQMVHGLMLRRSGNEEAAKKRFEQAAATQPDSPLPLLALAEGAEGEARAEALEKAVALLPASSPLLPGLLQKTGDAWIALGNTERAGLAWDRMVALDPANIELRQRLAEAYSMADAPDRAAPHYAYLEAHGDPATRAGALRSLARLRQGKGDTAAATELLEKAIALTSADNWLRGDLIAEIIRYHRQAGDIEVLMKRWQAAAESEPRSIMAWQQLAALYHQAGEPEKERQALEKLLTLQPENAPLKRDLARLLVKLDALQAAEPLLDELLAAQPAHQRDADLIFDRALLDIRLGKSEAARTRLDTFLNEQQNAASTGEDERDALLQRTLAFYSEHRLLEALEALLQRPESDPVELALFLFKTQRPDEARKALARVSGSDTSAKVAAHRSAAERLKQAGENEAALEQRQMVARLQPELREAWIALGDHALTLGQAHRKVAVEAFTRAVELSKESREIVEADQRLFRAYYGWQTVRETTPRTLSGAAGKAMEALLSSPSAPDPTPEPETGAALTEFIKRLEAEANGDTQNPARWMRLARWQLWQREFVAARAALEKAAALQPTDRDTLELGVAIAQGGGDPTEAVQWIKRLINAYPDDAPHWRKELALIRLQNGEVDEGLELLTELAASGDPAALADLARGQQQADRWYDALETWQRLYSEAKPSQRYELLQPLVRVLQRLELHPRASEMLWHAYEEQTDPVVRSAVLADLIAQCKNRNTLPWLLEKLRGRAEKPGAPGDIQALASALKADGKAGEAYDALRVASIATIDRATTEAELAKEAEELANFAQAAKHQQQRLLFLADPSADEWERLASLQEAALDYPAADETYLALARRFPRSTPVLLKVAAYFEKWGNEQAAAEAYEKVLAFDPMALAASAGVVRFSRNPETVANAARMLLDHSRSSVDSSELILPESSTQIGNHLRAMLHVMGTAHAPHGGGAGATGAGGGAAAVQLFNERGYGTGEAEWRLEAVRALARQVSEKDRAAWVKRWKMDKTASTSEKVWAFYYAGADREMMETLIAEAEAFPAQPVRRAAVVWMGLYSEAWPELSRWLWGPGRAAIDYDNYRSLLGVWAQLGRPLDSEALLKKAPVVQSWSTAEVLATKDRLRDAAQIGKRLLSELTAPLDQLGGEPCLKLSQWLLDTGDTVAAEALLRQIALVPADSLDSPTYAAQRALYLILPPLERDAWVREMRERKGSLIFTAHTAAVLSALEGKPDAMKQAVGRLVTLGSGTLTEAPAADRIWHAVLRAGLQFEAWNLPEAAICLWETALADSASLQLHGERAQVYTQEIRRRLGAMKLIRANTREAVEILDGMVSLYSLAELQQLAALLENSGQKIAAAQVQEAMKRKEPRLPLNQVLNAYKSTGDDLVLKARVEEWCAHPERDLASAPAVLGTLAQWDTPRAIQIAKQIAADIHAHPELLTLLGELQLATQDWAGAAETFQRLLGLEPHNPALPVKLATAQAAMGYKEEALDQLRKVARKAPGIDLKRLELALEIKDAAMSRQIAAEMLQGGIWESVADAGRLFAEAGQWQEGAMLLSAAVDSAEALRKGRGAFEIQKGLVVRMASHFPPATGQRWMKRLNRLAKGWPDLLSASVEAGRDAKIVSMQEQIDSLRQMWDGGRGEPVAGAWLLSHLLDTPLPTEAVLNELLACPELPSALLRWLRTRCDQSAKPDYCMKIDAELLRRHPNATDDLVAAVRMLHTQGQREQALAMLEKALARLPFAPADFTGKLALLAYDLGETALARRLFEAAIPTDTAALQTAVFLGYARLLMMDGDFPATKRVLRDAFRNPANHEAQAVVEYLKRSGRDTPEMIPVELRDLDLRPGVKTKVEELLSAPSAAAAPKTAERTPPVPPAMGVE